MLIDLKFSMCIHLSMLPRLHVEYAEIMIYLILVIQVCSKEAFKLAKLTYLQK